MSKEKKKEPYEKPETIPKINGKVWDFIADLAIGRKWIYVANMDEAEHLSIELTRMLFSIKYRWCLYDLYRAVDNFTSKPENLENIKAVCNKFMNDSNIEISATVIETMKDIIEIVGKHHEIKKIMEGVGKK